MTDKVINLDTYRPLSLGDLEFIKGPNIPIPDRDLMRQRKMIARWETVQLQTGTIVTNLVHRDYPGTYCQVQMAPDLAGRYHVYMLHEGPREIHIREEVVDKLFTEEMAPQILNEVARRNIC